MLTSWRKITKREYPGRQDLLYMITSPCHMSIVLLSYFLLLYLPNVRLNFALALIYKAYQSAYHKKSKKCGGGLQWDECMKNMVLGLLSHRTPPSCIAANILAVAKILCPHTKIVKELPIIYFLRVCRISLSFFAKLLAAYQLGKADKFFGYHSNGTQRRQI